MGKTFQIPTYSDAERKKQMEEYNKKRYGKEPTELVDDNPLRDMIINKGKTISQDSIEQYKKQEKKQNTISTIPAVIKNHLTEVYDNTSIFYENIETKGLLRREGQENFSYDIIDLLDSKNKYLVKEAGVGIGKSYAYLLPIFYYIKSYYKQPKIIISTSTISLQEQLLKDINNLIKMTGIDLKYTLVKGMNNYYCLNNVQKNSYLKNKVKISQDRKYNQDLTAKEWEKISIKKCNSKTCKNKYNCEYYKVKENIQNNNNNITICNHNMLINYLPQDNNFISDSNIIICDEAHNLENVIKDYYTENLDINHVFNRLKFLETKLGEFTNRIPISKKIYEEIKKQINTKINNNINIGTQKDEITEIDIELNDNLTQLLTELKELLYNVKTRINNNDELIKLILQNKNTDYFDELDEEISSYILEINSLLMDDNIIWLETNNDNYSIKFINKELYNLKDSLFNKYRKKMIFTSATLTTNNDYLNFMNSIGLKEPETEISDIEQSPYDYDNNSLLFIPKDIPSPKEKEKYLESLIKYIYELIEMTDGKSLVLFTSKTDMKYVYEKIIELTNKNNIYIQQEGSSQEQLKEKFKNDINSVLFSTGTFWEGIDIKGESLSNLIIAKLPFPVVTPYLEYKREQEEPNGFEKVYLNEMIIKLKQGCGRLIRSEKDKGIISILDSRSYKYLNDIINSINTKNYTDNINNVYSFVSDNIYIKIKK